MHQSAFEHIRSAFGRHYDPERHKTALDVGSWVGSAKKYTHRDLTVGTDLEYRGLDVRAGLNVDIVMDEPYTFPLADGSVDIIFCGQVFEHIPFFWATFVEMGRVLRRGGYILLSAPSRGHVHAHPTDCWRFYPDGMRALAAFAGLDLVSAHTDFPPKTEGGGRLDYAKVSSYRYWGDTVGVFTKTDDYPAAAIGPLRNALSAWSNSRSDLAIRKPADRAPAAAAAEAPVTLVDYAGGPIRVAVREPVVSALMRGKIVDGSYEKNEIGLAPRLLDTDEIVLEIGSGVGLVSTAAARTGKVKALHCFEADPRLIELIRRTHAANEVKGAEVHNVVLTSDKGLLGKGKASFHLREHFWGSSLQQDRGREVLSSVEVPTRSFGDAVRSIRPTIIYCDIEGAEKDLFRDADLASVRHIMLETHQSVIGGEGMRVLFDDLHRAGFHYDQRYSRFSVVVFTSTSKGPESA